MIQRKTNRRSSARQTCQYQGLEPRNLLATVFQGTNDADTASIEYVNDTQVHVTINDLRHENVDVSDGLRIDLGDHRDEITVDSRVGGDVRILNAEVIRVDGGDNDLRIRTLPRTFSGIQPLSESSNASTLFLAPPTTFGILNGNILLMNFSEIHTGEGQDTFRLVDAGLTENQLMIYSGGGDDLFRVSSRSVTAANNFDSDSGNLVANTAGLVFVESPFATKMFGEAGNDRFVFNRTSLGVADGGDGLDVVDYSRSERNIVIDAGGVVDGAWTNGNERTIGSVGFSNSVLASDSDGQTLNWVISGRQARLIDLDSGASVRLFGFSSFSGNADAEDRFWVRRTDRDLAIIDADRVQISSHNNPLQGNVDGVGHDITLIRRTAPTGLLTFGDPVVHQPEVYISGATGSGRAIEFNNDQSISGFGDGVIRLVDQASPFIVTPEFRPEVTAYGSASEGNTFSVGDGWRDVNLISGSGDDQFVIGSRDSGLSKIGVVNIDAGDGVDRLLANNRAAETNTDRDGNVSPAQYQLSDSGLIAEVAPVVISDSGDFFESGGGWQAELNFVGGLELARVVGVRDATIENQFEVTPSPEMAFAVAGNPLPNTANGNTVRDSLTIAGPLASTGEVASSEDPRSGSVTFGDAARRIRFENLDVFFSETAT